MARRTKRTRFSFPPIENLHFGERDVRAEQRDWGEGWGEEWDYIRASRCNKCGKVVFGAMRGDRATHKDLDHTSSCGGAVPGSDGPMMNKLWPLTTYSGTPEEAAAAIVDQMLCVVVDENHEMLGLALTGAGNDYSWDIAEAYMRLGCYPPLVIRLQREARVLDEKDKWIIEGMRRSIESKKERLDDDLKDLDRTLVDSREREKKKRAKEAPKRTVNPHGRCDTSRVCLEHAANPRVKSCKTRGKGRRTP